MVSSPEIEKIGKEAVPHGMEAAQNPENVRQDNVRQAHMDELLSTLRQKPALIVLTGHPGVGKKTIATKIHEIINSDTPLDALRDYGELSTLFHNHLILDLALAISPWDDRARHVDVRARLLSLCIPIMAQDRTKTRSFIVTAQIQVDPDRYRIDELELFFNFAQFRGLQMHWFDLTCSDVETHLARLTHEDRAKTKTKDPDLLQKCLNDPLYRQATPADLEQKDHRGQVHYMRIDTYGREPYDVAMQILAAIVPSN